MKEYVFIWLCYYSIWYNFLINLDGPILLRWEIVRFAFGFVEYRSADWIATLAVLWHKGLSYGHKRWWGEKEKICQWWGYRHKYWHKFNILEYLNIWSQNYRILRCLLVIIKYFFSRNCVLYSSIINITWKPIQSILPSLLNALLISLSDHEYLTYLTLPTNTQQG